jgi:hypothetical protein
MSVDGQNGAQQQQQQADDLRADNSGAQQRIPNMATALSLEDINKIEDSTMRTVALAMFSEMDALRKQAAADRATTDSLRRAKLEEATKKRADRIAMLSRLSPAVKQQLDAMVGQQGAAMSLGDDGTIRDPMKATLDMLEAAMQERVNLPRLLTSDAAALSMVPQPSDGELTAEATDAIAETMARMMGCAPRQAG